MVKSRQKSKKKSSSIRSSTGHKLSEPTVLQLKQWLTEHDIPLPPNTVKKDELLKIIESGKKSNPLNLLQQMHRDLDNYLHW
jgi:hypothetical protein